MFMPIMDHRIVANMKPGESAWIADRAFSVLSGDCDMKTMRDDVSVNGLAHTYTDKKPGTNTWIVRLSDGTYYVKYFPLDREGYIPFWIHEDQVTGATPVNIDSGSRP